MIYSTEEHLRITRQQLERVESALEALRREVEPKSLQQFLVFAEGYVSEIQQLRETIDELTGVREVVEHVSDLSIHLEGEGIRIGQTPVSVVTQFIERLRKGLQALGRCLDASQNSRSSMGRPTNWLSRLSDPTLDALSPGSIGIHLSAPSDDLLDDTSESFRKVVRLLLQGVEWSVGEDRPLLEEEEDDIRLQHTLISVVQTLIPSSTSKVHAVRFGGRIVQGNRRLQLTRAAAPKLRAALLELTAASQQSREIGTMRELDLDRRSFILRSRPENKEPLSCFYEEHLEQEVKEALDKRVIATGLLVSSQTKPKTHLKVELLEEIAAEDQQDLSDHNHCVALEEKKP